MGEWDEGSVCDEFGCRVVARNHDVLHFHRRLAPITPALHKPCLELELLTVTDLTGRAHNTAEIT